MDYKVFVLLVIFAVAVTDAHSPVFLERNGVKICTLNKLGAIPAGSVTYPVYQKVCRAVTPVLGAPLADEEGGRRSNSEKYDDDEAAQVRRAIMSS